MDPAAAAVFVAALAAFIWPAEPFLRRLVACVQRALRPAVDAATRDKSAAAVADVTALRAELRTISAVDEFAKYARAQRKLAAAEETLAKLGGGQQKQNPFAPIVTKVAIYVIEFVAFTWFLWTYSGTVALVVPAHWWAPMSSWFVYWGYRPGEIPTLFLLFLAQRTTTVLNHCVSYGRHLKARMFTTRVPAPAAPAK